MKKAVLVVLMVFFTVPGVFAGDIANIFALNIMMGTFGGAAAGTALSVPSYLEGDGQNSKIFAAGAGWGALIGASVGFIYSFYNVAIHIERKQGNLIKNGYMDNDDFKLYLTYGENVGIKLTKNF